MTLRGVPIVLASASPRRRELLELDGAIVRVVTPAIEDSGAEFGGGDASRLVASLAWFKAAQVLGRPEVREGTPPGRWLVAADTMCVLDGRAIGKPENETAAREMLESMSKRAHEVLTGVCVIDLAGDGRRLFVDRAVVSIGALDERAIARHLADGRWRDRAGGYHFGDARRAGWPIECEGDETTVVGLPMVKLRRMLAGAGAGAGAGAAGRGAA